MTKKISKKVRGRPKIDNPASVSLGSVRLTPDQASDYRKVAESEKLPVATWVKQELDRAVSRWRKKHGVGE